jgi:hypothetical protein
MALVHPVAITGGPRLFQDLRVDLTLRLLTATPFAGGVVVLHYAVVANGSAP